MNNATEELRGAGPSRRRFTFPKSARLSRQRDLERVRGEGQRAGREWFTLFALAVPGEARRLAVVCGKKVGGAVVRNRVRRRVREIFRTHPEVFRDGYWFAVHVRPGAAAVPFQKLKVALVTACEELIGKNN